jgi:hypothetical protein
MYKSKKLRRKSEELALTERRCFLFLAMALGLVTLASPVLGLHSLLPAGTGAGTGLSALAGYLRR